MWETDVRTHAANPSRRHTARLPLVLLRLLLAARVHVSFVAVTRSGGRAQHARYARGLRYTHLPPLTGNPIRGCTGMRHRLPNGQQPDSDMLIDPKKLVAHVRSTPVTIEED